MTFVLIFLSKVIIHSGFVKKAQFDVHYIFRVYLRCNIKRPIKLKLKTFIFFYLVTQILKFFNTKNKKI